jgi:hypothetical protein
MEWQKEKPDYACVFLTRHNGEYSLWQFVWEIGEPPENEPRTDEESKYYYLAWVTNDGDEWDDIADCNFDEYLVLGKLKTMDEVHKEWIQSMKNT